MTITITFEDLKAHETALQKWASDRVGAEGSWLLNNFRPPGQMLGGGPWDLPGMEKALHAWEKQNPRPTLIPYQREPIQYIHKMEPGGFLQWETETP